MNSVLLITVDCLRPDHVGAYGYGRDTTPNIDDVAKDGQLYEQPYSNGPGTRWAFRALNMGLHPLRIDGAGLPHREGQTLAEILSAEGYRTAAFADNPFLSSYFNQDRGFEEFHGTSHYSDTGSSATDVLERINSIASKVSQSLSDGVAYKLLKRLYDSFLAGVESTTEHSLSSDRQVVDDAIQWINDNEGDDSPYFAWIHLMDAHHPHQYHFEHRSALNIPEESEHVRLPTKFVEPGGKPPESVIDTYDANLREADAHVGRLIEHVEGDPLIVITGDHGEEFGRHREFHSASVFESIARVPLIFSGPGIESKRISKPVSHIDVPPTILANSTKAKIPSGWDGRSLIDGNLSDEAVYLGIEKPGIIESAVIVDNWKLHRYLSEKNTIEREMLFDLDADPHEENDLQNKQPKNLKKLRRYMKEYIDDVLTNRLQSQHELYNPEEKESMSYVIEGGFGDSPTNDIEERLEALGYRE